MEIHAIGRSAQFNIDTNYQNQEVIIMFDSETAIKAMSSDVTSCKMAWANLPRGLRDAQKWKEIK